jgi:enoyl-CoA hydratase
MAGPTFDASLALEFLGFGGPEMKEGHLSLVEKRRPKFPHKAPY